MPISTRSDSQSSFCHVQPTSAVELDHRMSRGGREFQSVIVCKVNNFLFWKVSPPLGLRDIHFLYKCDGSETGWCCTLAFAAMQRKNFFLIPEQHDRVETPSSCSLCASICEACVFAVDDIVRFTSICEKRLRTAFESSYRVQSHGRSRIAPSP